MLVAINNSKNQKTISSSIVYPGDSRLIQEDEVHEALAKGFDVPNHTPPEPIETSEKPLPQELSTEALVDMTLKELDGLISELTDDQILSLESAEKASKSPRTSLFKMLEKEMSERVPGE